MFLLEIQQFMDHYEFEMKGSGIKLIINEDLRMEFPKSVPRSSIVSGITVLDKKLKNANDATIEDWENDEVQRAVSRVEIQIGVARATNQGNIAGRCRTQASPFSKLSVIHCIRK